MNIRTAVVFGVLVFCFALPAAAKPAVPPLNNWQTFTSASSSFQFDYPAADYYGAGVTVNLNIANLDKLQLEKISGAKSQLIYTVKTVSSTKTISQLKSLMKKELALSSKATVKTADIKLGGLPAIKMTAAKQGLIVGIISDGKAYLLQSLMANNPKDVLFEKLLASFKLLPPPPLPPEVFELQISSSTCALNAVTASWGGQVIYVRAIVSGTAQGPVGTRLELPLLIWSDDKWNCGDWTYHSGALIAVGGSCVRQAGQPEMTGWTVDTGGEEQGDWLKGKTRSYTAKIYRQKELSPKKEAKTTMVCQ